MLLLSTRQQWLRLALLMLVLLIGILISPVRAVLAAASTLNTAPGVMSGDVVACSRIAASTAAKPVRSAHANIEGALFGPIMRPLAATITVNTTTDEMTDNSTCSLREAIIAANTNSNAHENACSGGSDSSADTINLANGATYALTIDGDLEDDALTGDLDIRDNSAGTDLILKAGSSGATITQNATTDDRVLHIVDPDASVQFKNLFITGGSADIGGGVYNDGALLLDRVRIDNNAATVIGGGLYTCLGSAVIQNGSVISDNTAPDGAGIYVDGALTIDNSAVSDNVATGAGGGVSGNSTSVITLQNNTLINSNDALNGGGVFSGGILTINQSAISDNSADMTLGAGGGLFTSSGSTTTIENNSLIGGIGQGNQASSGGNIHNFGTLTINASVLFDGQAGVGGGIYNDGTVTIENGSFISEGQADDGGGIFNNTALTVDSSTINDNDATDQGGGIYMNGGTLDVDNGSVISGNSAATSGGGIWNDTAITFDETRFEGNSAANGAALYNDSSFASATITASIIADGTGDAGTGLYNNGGTLTVTGSAIINNVGTGNGDAVFNNNNVVDAVSVTASCIAGNGDNAFFNNTVSSQDATGNWWGAADGPSGNGPGSGDSVSLNVDFTGFLTSDPGLCVENLLLNGSFETDTTPADGKPDDWAAKNVIISPTQDGLDVTESSDGPQSFRFVGDGNGSKLFQDVTISGGNGDSFTLTFDTESLNAGGSGAYKVKVMIYNNDGTKTAFKEKLLAGTNAWDFFTINATATKPFNKIRVQIQYTMTQGFVWFDNFVLTQN